MQARIAVLESELEACRRPPSRKKEFEMHMMHNCIQNDYDKCNVRISNQQVSPLPNASGYQQQQGLQGQGRKCGHGKTADGSGGKQARKENKEEKDDRRL